MYEYRKNNIVIRNGWWTMEMSVRDIYWFLRDWGHAIDEVKFLCFRSSFRACVHFLTRISSLKRLLFIEFVQMKISGIILNYLPSKKTSFPSTFAFSCEKTFYECVNCDNTADGVISWNCSATVKDYQLSMSRACTRFWAVTFNTTWQELWCRELLRKFSFR